MFLLCKTSNSGSEDLQDVMVTIDNRLSTMEGDASSIVHGPSSVPLYEHIAQLAQTWNTQNNIGLVVGATHVDAMKRVRAAAPDLWFLTPGVGAQGGELEAAMKAGLRKDGKGMLIPISRGISRAENPKLAAAEIRDQILEIREELRCQ